MSAAPAARIAAPAGSVIHLDARRKQRPAMRRQALMIVAVFGLCLLGLIGSVADSAVARTGFLLIGSTDAVDPAKLDSIAMTLIWATLANLGVCAGVAMIAFWLVSRPSAEVVELRPRRRRHVKA